MSNYLLLTSTILCSLLHLYYIINIDIYIVFGLITSILNHSFTSIYLKNLDRFVMIYCFFIDISITNNKILCILRGFILANLNLFINFNKFFSKVLFSQLNYLKK